MEILLDPKFKQRVICLFKIAKHRLNMSPLEIHHIAMFLIILNDERYNGPFSNQIDI